MSLSAGEGDLSLTSSSEIKQLMLHQPLTRNILYQGSQLKPNWLTKNVKEKTHCHISISYCNGGVVTDPGKTSPIVGETHTGGKRELFMSSAQLNLFISSPQIIPWFPNLIKLNCCSSCPRFKNDCLTLKYQVKLFISTTQSRKPTISYFYQPMNPAAARGWIAKLRHQLAKWHPRQPIWNMFFWR